MSAIVKHPFLQRLLRVPPAYYVFAILLITLWIARPHMLNANIMGIFIRQVAPLGVLVLAQLLVMRVKSIDLSGGGIILLVNYFISSGIFPGASMPFFIGLSLATGTAIGLFNGWMRKSRASGTMNTIRNVMVSESETSMSFENVRKPWKEAEMWDRSCSLPSCEVSVSKLG